MVGRQNGLVGILHAGNRPRARDVGDIHDHLLAAIIDQRLPPGTRLGEEALVEVFNLGRRQIGAALDLLVWEGVVTRPPNRGARVSTPDAAEARDIFQARRAIEVGLVETLAQAAPEAALRALDESIAQERALRAHGRIREAVRLSGAFHVLLAQAYGNAILAAQVRLLVARTSLVIALFEAPVSLACWCDDHAALLAHIRAGRPHDAASLMRRHLQALEDGLDLTRPVARGLDLRSAFRTDA